ncbi:MAG TPA: hypothetical protein VF823_12785, partial [Anaerolineales bacterium]
DFALKAHHAAVAEEVVHFHAQTLAAVHEQLGEQAFQSAWAEGSGWSLEEAVNIALEKGEDGRPLRATPNDINTRIK